MLDPTALSCVRRPASWVFVAALLLLTLFAFAGVADNGFINYDDGDYLTANPMVAQGLTAKGIAWAFTTTHSANWHPLTWLSHMLDVELFGMNPGAHHLASLALHAANTAALFLALRLMTGALWRSALVAVLFAVHPLHVESVAWAAERKDVLSTLFTLAALIAYVRAVRCGRVSGSFPLLACYLLALLAKPMPVSLPFLLLLLDWWPLGRWAPTSDSGKAGSPIRRWARVLPPARLWLEKAPLFLLAAALSVITLAVQRGGTAMAFGHSLPLGRRLVNALLGYGFYAGKAVWPVDLAIFYPYPVAAPAWWLRGAALSLLAGVSWLLLRGLRRRPWLAVGWLWFAGALVPMIGLVHVGYQAWADRYTYLPMVGLFLAAAWALGDLAAARPAFRKWLACCACAALLALSALTRDQVARWHDNFTLYRQAIAVTECNWLAWNLLGNAFSEKGELEQAVGAYRAAARCSRELGVGATVVGFNLAVALHAQGNTREAADAYRDVLRRNPADRDALNNLGNIAFGDGQLREATELYRRALAADTGFAAGHYNLARALAAQDDLGGAAGHLRETLELDPRDTAAAALLRDVRAQQDARGSRPAPRR